jgi:hypothetical protein
MDSGSITCSPLEKQASNFRTNIIDEDVPMQPTKEQLSLKKHELGQHPVFCGIT